MRALIVRMIKYHVSYHSLKCWSCFSMSPPSMRWTSLLTLNPPQLTEDLSEFLETYSSTKAIVRSIHNSLNQRMVGYDGWFRDYILQVVGFPIINHALTSYFVVSQFSLICYSSVDAFKNTFNIFALTSPPTTCNT